MKALVSGATGLVGGELCRQLNRLEVPFVALSRGGGRLPGGAATIPLDFNSEEVPSRLLADVDVVFHLAGIAHQQAGDAVYARVNHRATLSLARACAAAGVKCFIFLSSVKAMGPPQGDAKRHEEEVSAPTSAYGRSKWQAEQELRAAFCGDDMSVVVLRPSLVYGAQMKGNLLALSRAVRAGIPRPPERGGRSMIAVQDLVGLMLQLATDPPQGVHTWIVCDGQRYSARCIYDLMRIALDKRPGSSWLPLWAWRLGAYLADGLRDRGADSRYEKLFGTELYSSATLMGQIPWQPSVELADVVSDMMAAPHEKSR